MALPNVETPLTLKRGRPPLFDVNGIPGMPSCEERLSLELNCNRSVRSRVYPARNSLITCGEKICVSLNTPCRVLLVQSPEENAAAESGGGIAAGGVSDWSDML